MEFLRLRSLTNSSLWLSNIRDISADRCAPYSVFLSPGLWECACAFKLGQLTSRPLHWLQLSPFFMKENQCNYCRALFCANRGEPRRSTCWVFRGICSETAWGAVAGEPMYCFHHRARFSRAHPLFFRNDETPSN